ncbi:hypothetical protein HUE46_10115 [Flavobacterium columnare]|uniref:Nucleoside phosphorylase domain-containing protein n=2 Tax=Flavobacterium columnare TaxID=996 RepID=A0AAI8GAM2_9FLAO|nr:hypothetical protein [Flavobacterium columnare]AMO20033.1 hypothetical protein UN65_06405 [Flavobacterium columnare]AUX17978.1 hypothetical protein AQ623_06550 [Flavobacterium columnare]MEB3800908.1 hypothetical protein [Flavobacterium columnare]QOG57046.1 hypothetical protein HUE29_06475 [Flavobacterium columnare]QOG59770.1 hypothetical protein HUE30_06475 [Flavobacterium columnare]
MAKIIILTPMEIEKKKVETALSQLSNLTHSYQIVVSGIGRESTAKTLINLPAHDVCVLMGFAAIVGKESELPPYLALGKPIEITNASLYGYEGGMFENGKPITVNPQTNLPCLHSLTSDKFVRTTNLAVQTVVNMEDYTFMYLKKPQDFIIRIISDFLPHETEIDFFEEVKGIQFLEAVIELEKI